MNDSPHYSLALLPPREVAAPLAAIRAQLDPDHAARSTPHITLKQPFLFTGGQHDEAQLLQAVQRVCNDAGSFPLTLSGVDSFVSPTFGCVVYLCVRESPALRALAHALVHTLVGIGADSGRLDAEHECRLYHPHLTLAQGLTPDAGMAAVRSLSHLASVRFQARRVVIGRRHADGVWHMPHELSLRDHAPVEQTFRP